MKLISKLKSAYIQMPIQAKLAIWTFLCMCTQKSISIITVPIFTRMLTTNQYGQYSVYTSWLNIATIITTFRLYDGVYSKGLSKYKHDMPGYALSMQYTTSIMTCICICAYLLFRGPINQMTEMSTFITLLMFIQLFFTPPLLFWTVRQRYVFKYKMVVAATLILAVLNPVLGLVFVMLSKEKGLARIVSMAVAQICVGSVFYAINIKKGGGKYKTEYARFAFLFNLPLIPHYFSEYILQQSDRIMIQKMIGYAQAGVYSIAYNAGMLMTVVSSSLNQALVPWLYQELDKKNFSSIKKNISNVGILVACIIGVFIMFTPELVNILGGEKYKTAVYIVPPVTISVYFLFWYILFANVEFYYNKNKFTMWISMSGAILNIFLNLICISSFGYIAAGYTSFICFMVYSIGHYIYMERIFFKQEGQYLFDVRSYGITAVLLTVFSFMIMLVYDYIVIRYGCMLLLLAAAFINRRKINQNLKVLIKKRR